MRSSPRRPAECQPQMGSSRMTPRWWEGECAEGNDTTPGGRQAQLFAPLGVPSGSSLHGGGDTGLGWFSQLGPCTRSLGGQAKSTEAPPYEDMGHHQLSHSSPQKLVTSFTAGRGLDVQGDGKIPAWIPEQQDWRVGAVF